MSAKRKPGRRDIVCLVRTWRALQRLDALTDDQILEEDDHWQDVAAAFAEETADRNNPEDAHALARFGAGQKFMRRMVEDWLADLPHRLLRRTPEELDEIGELLGVERGDLRDTSYAFRRADALDDQGARPSV